MTFVSQVPRTGHWQETISKRCVCVCVCVRARLVAKSCLTLFDPMDCSLPGSSVHGIFQARVLEWVAISFSREGIFPLIQGSNPCLLPWQADSLPLRPQASSSNDQFSSVAQSCPTICDPMNRSTPGLPVHHQLLESTQTHVH